MTAPVLASGGVLAGSTDLPVGSVVVGTDGALWTRTRGHTYCWVGEQDGDGVRVARTDAWVARVLAEGGHVQG